MQFHVNKIISIRVYYQKYREYKDGWINNHKPLFHSSQKPTRKLAARTFIQSQNLKQLAASLQVGFGDEWKRGYSVIIFLRQTSAASGNAVTDEAKFDVVCFCASL